MILCKPKKEFIEMVMGERIKQARIANGLSLRSLAEKVDVSAMAISKYERGMDIPSSSILIRLADALNVSLDSFFRSFKASIELKAYRKHAKLGKKEEQKIKMKVQDWAEQYFEIEEILGENVQPAKFPKYTINTLQDAEEAAINLRNFWNIGLDPIENIIGLIEDQGIKVGLVDADEDFDACTYEANNSFVIVSKAKVAGDRQRFNLGHELGHIVLDISDDIDAEKACNRFVAAFLVPEQVAKKELGQKRTVLNPAELYILKQKYGMSMKAWVYRAKDLNIISESAARSIFQQFSARKWNAVEPGEAYPSESPSRMSKLVYKAKAEDLISASKARELLQNNTFSDEKGENSPGYELEQEFCN